MLPILRVALAGFILSVVPLTGNAQGVDDPAGRAAAQRQAMKALDRLDGMWRGPAWTVVPSGRHEMIQTERVGPFLDGAVKVIEGRGYNPDGTVGFNAFAIVSYDPDRRAYNFRSYAQGRSGDFVLTPTAEGFIWEIPAGAATIRFTAVVTDSTWHEIGERIVPGQQPVRFIELNLARIGDTDWPAAGAVAPR